MKIYLHRLNTSTSILITCCIIYKVIQFHEMKSLCLYLLGTTIVFAASGLDQSRALGTERSLITADFAKAQSTFRNAKDEAGRQASYKVFQDVSVRLSKLRADVISANSNVITALNTQRSGTRDRSATIKVTTEKLTRANSVLSALNLPAGPDFTTADINDLQKLCDKIKVTLDEHTHACANLK